MPRIFSHYNTEGPPCPICKTSEDKPCILAVIDGTDDDGICEAKPVHVECLSSLEWRFNQENGLIYSRVES